jgi:hypothetical protein
MPSLFFVVAALLVVATVPPSYAKSVSKCSEAEHAELQKTHLSCTKQVSILRAVCTKQFFGVVVRPKSETFLFRGCRAGGKNLVAQSLHGFIA